MTRRLLPPCIAIVFVTVLTAPAVWGDGKPARSLYERIGRYDAISAIAEQYLKGVRSDPRFTRFTGRGADSLKRAKQLLKDHLCALTGGPCTYPGRDMKTAHGGLAITEAEWAISTKYMTAALDAERVPAKEKQEFLALIEGLKPEIVEKPGASSP
jgi:hemoglobin